VSETVEDWFLCPGLEEVPAGQQLALVWWFNSVRINFLGPSSRPRWLLQLLASCLHLGKSPHQPHPGRHRLCILPALLPEEVVVRAKCLLITLRCVTVDKVQGLVGSGPPWAYLSYYDKKSWGVGVLRNSMK
jgi:hypothetical protein